MGRLVVVGVLLMMMKLILRRHRQRIVGAQDRRVGGGGGDAGDLLVDGRDEPRGVVRGNLDVQNRRLSRRLLKRLRIFVRQRSQQILGRFYRLQIGHVQRYERTCRMKKNFYQ